MTGPVFMRLGGYQLGTASSGFLPAIDKATKFFTNSRVVSQNGCFANWTDYNKVFSMKCHFKSGFHALALFTMALASVVHADQDERPPGLEQAIRNPSIPMIVDATISKFTKEGYGTIKINKVYKASKVVLPKQVKGYSSGGTNPRIVPLKIITDRGKTRFLFFLKADLLYSTYNNRFEIRQDKEKQLVVDTGAGWKPLKEMVALIPATKPKKK